MFGPRLLVASTLGVFLIASGLMGGPASAGQDLGLVSDGACSDWSIEAAIDRAIEEHGGVRYVPWELRSGSRVAESGSGQSSGLELEVRPIGDPEGEWGLDLGGFSFLGLGESTIAVQMLEGAALEPGEPTIRGRDFPMGHAPEHITADEVAQVGEIIRFQPLRCNSSVFLSFERDGSFVSFNRDFEIVFLNSTIALDAPEARRVFHSGGYLDALYSWGEWTVAVYSISYFSDGNSTYPPSHTNEYDGEFRPVEMDDYEAERDALASVPVTRLEERHNWTEGIIPYPPYFIDENGTRYYHHGMH